VLFERAFDAIDDGILPLRADVGNRDHVGIMRAPVADADLGILRDDLLEADRLSGRGVEQRVAFVGGGPLGTGNEILAAFFGRAGAAACFHQALD
jgi:hypothetical protein